MTRSTTTPQDIILDTNVVLDWLVFEHGSGLVIGDAVIRGELRWIVSPAMHEELIDVLGRLLYLPSLLRWSHRHAPAMAGLATWANPVPPPGPLPYGERLRCTDPDDQCFIDLAVAHQALLLSKDKAVLSMRKRLFALNVSAQAAILFVA